MSQFGYIISIAALTSQSVANLHITTHAAFKCCLFMAAGIVIHSINDIQDNRQYGSLIKFLPIGYIATLLCTISLIAIPYTSGSLSKDLILEVHAAQYSINNHIAFIIGTVVASITALYSVKLLIITYIGPSNMSITVYEKIHGANYYAYLPLIVLSILAIVLGYISMPILVDSHGYFDNIIIAELFNINIKLIPVLFVLLGILLAIA
jgi:NADH-ubiquinone oxidoreductase chain 5